jgi:LuxR family maltose regulon positive regulatory protein
MQRMPEVAAVQVLVLLRQRALAAAAQLAQRYELPLSRARVLLAGNEVAAALALLDPLRQQMDTRGWQDERLNVMVVQAVALHAHGQHTAAGRLLDEVLVLAEPGGFIRLFVDEGEPMRRLLLDVRSGREKHLPPQDQQSRRYVTTLLDAFGHP